LFVEAQHDSVLFSKGGQLPVKFELRSSKKTVKLVYKYCSEQEIRPTAKANRKRTDEIFIREKPTLKKGGWTFSGNSFRFSFCVLLSFFLLFHRENSRKLHPLRGTNPAREI
jgi:hypothetical protein